MSTSTTDVHFSCNGTDYLNSQCYFDDLPCGAGNFSNQLAPFNVNDTVLVAYQCGMKEQGSKNSSSIDISDLNLHCNGTLCFYTGIPCAGGFYNELAPGYLNSTVRTAYECGKEYARVTSLGTPSAETSLSRVLVLLLLFMGIFVL